MIRRRGVRRCPRGTVPEPELELPAGVMSMVVEEGQWNSDGAFGMQLTLRGDPGEVTLTARDRGRAQPRLETAGRVCSGVVAARARVVAEDRQPQHGGRVSASRGACLQPARPSRRPHRDRSRHPRPSGTRRQLPGALSSTTAVRAFVEPAQ